MKRILFLVAALSLIAASDDPWPPKIPKLKRTDSMTGQLYLELIDLQKKRMDPVTTKLVGEPSEREKQVHALLVAELLRK
jgi:hypothetical protein